MTASITYPPVPPIDPLLPPQSHDVDEISHALAIVQGQLEHATKSEEGKIVLKDNKGQYTFKYADLPAMINLSKALLAENGMSATHRSLPAQGGIRVQTVLRHSSGQFLADGAPFLPVAKADDPKAYGSAISYLRRYGLGAMLGIAQEDDDAQQAATKPAAKRAPATKLAPIEDRDKLEARIKALPDLLQKQVAERLRDGSVVWTQLTKDQFKQASEWTAEAEDVAEAES